MDIKQGIRRNFARRAASYDRHAGVQRLMAEELAAKTAAILPRAGRILEIGCGTGYLTGLIREANSAALLVALDLDAALVIRARARLAADPDVAWLVADGEAWSRGGFDLIMSNATFQWLTRPAATLAAYRRSLAGGGALAFSTLGPKTFFELQASLKTAAGALNLACPPEIPAQNFLDREAWTALLHAAGFSNFRIWQETHTTSFPSVEAFLKGLQATGSTNPRPRAFSPRLLKGLMAAYQAAFSPNGKVPVTYEIIWVVAQK